MPKRAPKVVVIYIGSNDLSAADCGGNETELLAAVKPIVNRRAFVINSNQPIFDLAEGSFAALPQGCIVPCY